MADKKSLKTALIVSILMLMLCVASMIGSTYAWFTDQAVSGRNVIQAGTLDVELEYSRTGEDNDWHNTSSATRLFDESKTMLSGNSQMVFLKINNKGSLHLKYKLAMNIMEEQGSINMLGVNYELSDYIRVATVSDAELDRMLSQQGATLPSIKADYDICAATHESPANNGQTSGPANNSRPMSEATNLLRTVADPDLEEAYLAPGESHVIALIVHTPEHLDQEINYKTGANKPVIKFGIDVVAGQRSGAGAESDSFGNTYDKDATYPAFPSLPAQPQP